jgi:flagellar basal body P-ring formation protein FlgA
MKRIFGNIRCFFPGSVFGMMLLLIGMPLFAGDLEMTNIHVFEKVEIEQEKIYLGSIAVIEGKDLEMVQQLKNIYIGQSPLPGKTRRVDANYIKVRLKQNNMDFSSITLRIPRETTVLRKFIRVTHKQIEKIVMDNTGLLLPFDTDQVTIKEIDVSGEAVLPTGEMTYKIVPPKNTDFLGKVPLSIYFYVNGEMEKRVFATLETELLANVVIVRRPLKRNHTIRDIDIKLVRMNMAGVPSNCMVNPDDVLGKKTKRAVDAGDVLSSDLLFMPAILDRNDVVLMIAESDNFKITAMGMSQEKGQKGDRIKVMNLDSDKAVYARVIDEKTVAVDF